ncbi:NAD(+)/NADH kinase [Streptomyces flaveolus]|jgi:NAD+ kinase|uniref:NAD(+)/NADH kinase n=1 Tax=Streptomyces flaveolus TaxID=67297 RepID=UPI001670EABB|nr:NAD(+)/NADH kinase [Streptomyces flaveolus]GGQ56486.1 NAD kinase 1 [Streptomyces flaveolus]
MAVERAGLVVHKGRPEAVEASRSVRAWCDDHRIPCAEIDVWDAAEQRRSAREELEAAGNPDLIVTLGGDGTFLRGARLAAHNDSLLLGIDFGHVGFLTEVPARDVLQALDAVRESRVTVEARMLLTMRASRPLSLPRELGPLLRYGRRPSLPPPQVRPGCEAGGGWGVALDVLGLNEVVVEKFARDGRVAAAVYFAGRLLACYAGDALLVATPTGSTAYSFAASGPVVSPRAEALVFTPVAAHMVFNRSVLAAPDEPIAMRLLPHSGSAAVSVDGQLRGVLEPGDWIGVYAAPSPLRAVRLGPTDFYGRLRERLRLTDAPATASDAGVPSAWPLTAPPPHDLDHLNLPTLSQGRRLPAVRRADGGV